MKKIIIIIGIMAGLNGCKKANYYCYDQYVDQQGNVVPSTSGKVKKYFKNDDERRYFQQVYNKACIERP